MNEHNDYTHDNDNPIKQPLMNSGQDVLNDLDDLSMDIMKTQKQIDDIKEIIESNPTQKEFFQAQSNLETQISKLSEYQTLYSNTKDAFALFAYPSKADKEQFEKYSKKLEDTFSSLQRKVVDLSEQLKRIKQNKKYEDIENPMSSSNNSLPLANKLLQKNVIDQKEFLEKRGKALENAKIVSGQLNAMSKEMNVEINQQQGMLNQIEDNVIDIKEGVEKAQEDIEEAEEHNRSKNKRLLIMILIIVFVVIAVISIVLAIVLK